MINVLKKIMLLLINDMDAGNTSISEQDEEDLINLILKITSKELSKIEAADYVGVCRATFDNYISQGLIPKGKKRQGFKELSWRKVDLDNFLKNLKS